jgi:hypothetical protein
MVLTVAPGAFTSGIVSALNDGVQTAAAELAVAAQYYTDNPIIASASHEAVAKFIQSSQSPNIVMPGLMATEAYDILAAYTPGENHTRRMDTQKVV